MHNLLGARSSFGRTIIAKGLNRFDKLVAHQPGGLQVFLHILRFVLAAGMPEFAGLGQVAFPERLHLGEKSPLFRRLRALLIAGDRVGHLALFLLRLLFHLLLLGRLAIHGVFEVDTNGNGLVSDIARGEGTRC